MDQDEPNVPRQRQFGLNSREFYEFIRVPEADVWGPRLPRESLWRRDDPVCVWAEEEAHAETAFQDWLGRIETGRVV